MQTQTTYNKQVSAHRPALVIVHPATKKQKYQYGANHRPCKISLPMENGIRFVNTDEITHCQAQSNYSLVILADGEKILISKTLKWLEGFLPADAFSRPHSSYIVNLAYVTFAGKSQIMIGENIELPVSRRCHKSILLALRKYCHGQSRTDDA